MKMPITQVSQKSRRVSVSLLMATSRLLAATFLLLMATCAIIPTMRFCACITRSGKRMVALTRRTATVNIEKSALFPFPNRRLHYET